MRMPAICGRNSSESPRQSEVLQSSREDLIMKRCLLITALVALPLFVTSSVVALEDTPVFGKVTTKKKTALKTAPTAQAAAATTVDANTDLRWVMGGRKGKYVRVMIPKGPSGWVLEADVNKVAEADLASIALEGRAEPCVSPETLNACTRTKPTGCSSAGSAHGLVNQLKRIVPPEGTPTRLTFDTFSQLQSAAVELVDEGVEIPPAERDKIKSIETTEGTVGEGSRVRLVAFLSEGTPHANSGESVNCNLKREANNDIHVSVTETKDGSEFEGIVVEMIPQDRPANWTSSKIENLRGKVLLLEGGLFYDNLHFTNGDARNPMGGQPKRFSLWEIHPVTSLKVCKKARVSQCDPDKASDWKAF
jgi:hypothetical protein